MEIFKGDTIEITSDHNVVLIKKYRNDITFKDIEVLLQKYPRIKISSFQDLKKFIDEPSDDFVTIGTLLPQIDILLSKDNMVAKICFNENPENFVSNEDELNKKIESLASKMGINFGLKRVLWAELEKKKQMIIAEGKAAEDGKNAQVSYFQNPARKPTITDEGKADFSDMNFIFEIEKDAWLGEKIPPSEGLSGKTVLGEEIPAKAGKDLILKYDTNSVYEVVENGKNIIRAKLTGVLDDSQGKIRILQNLMINSDVGVETGDLEFEGSITIRGTILPGYSVRATGDISIASKDGVSGAKLIESTNGDVFIQGGVFGHSKTIIRAGGNVFIKHANEATIQAEEDIFIEAYSIGSDLTAKRVRLDEQKGKIIGGTVIAKQSIHTAVSGNNHERKTELIVESFDKGEKMAEIRFKAEKIKTLESEIKSLFQKVMQIEKFSASLSKAQQELFEDTKFQLDLKKSSLFKLNQEVQTMLKQVNEAGKEHIEVTKEAFQGTVIKIGKRSTTLNIKTKGVFKLENGELNV